MQATQLDQLDKQAMSAQSAQPVQAAALAHQKCVPCEGGTAPLTNQEEDNYLTAAPSWSVVRTGVHLLQKQFTLRNFAVANTFITLVAQLAEKQGHHPNLELSDYKKVTITLFTHAIGGLSVNDFIMATQIDQLWVKPPRPVILASASAQRYQLLAALGIEVTVVPSNLDEKSVMEDDPQKRVQKLALQKAQLVAKLHPDAIIISADSVVIHNHIILEKPETEAQAVEMLQELSGEWVDELTGVCYHDPAAPALQWQQSVTSSRGLLRTLTTAEINRYVAYNPTLSWAAAYSPVYPAGAGLIAQHEGSLTAFAHGLPMEVIVPLLHQSGVLQ